MDKTDIVIRELTQTELIAGNPFAHFGWEGDGAFSFLTISDGYWNSAKVLLEKMKEKCNDFAVVDSLVYPLFFNYRHSIETYLKLLFFKYGEQTESAKREFLKIGHNLLKLWTVLRPYLDIGKKHVGSSVDIDAMEHYIKSINDFDSNSMIMRYPIEKSLETNKEHEYRFDFTNFGKRMDELCDSLRQLDYDISNQMSEVATSAELNTYLGMVEKYRHQIDDFLSILKTSAKKETIKTFNSYDFMVYLQNDKPSDIVKFLKECDPDLLILLDNLFYGGQKVQTDGVHLASDPICKKQEFVRLCYDLLDNDKLRFGEKPQMEQINIWSKNASALLSALSTALSILCEN